MVEYTIKLYYLYFDILLNMSQNLSRFLRSLLIFKMPSTEVSTGKRNERVMFESPHILHVTECYSYTI